MNTKHPTVLLSWVLARFTRHDTCCKLWLYIVLHERNPVGLWLCVPCCCRHCFNARGCTYTQNRSSHKKVAFPTTKNNKKGMGGNMKSLDWNMTPGESHLTKSYERSSIHRLFMPFSSEVASNFSFPCKNSMRKQITIIWMRYNNMTLQLITLMKI